METRTYISHYSLCNGYKPFLKKVDGVYNYYVEGDITYKTETKQKSYNAKGDFLGYHYDNILETKKDCVKIDKELSVVQIDYKFYLLPIGRCVTIDEVSHCRKVLKNTFNIKDSKSFFTPYFGKPFNKGYNLPTFKKNEENFEPLEICAVGHSRNVYNKNFKIALNFNIKKYIKDKDNFIKQNPEWEFECKNLFNKNISFMMAFWQMNESQILKGMFNKRVNVIRKLNRKITNYEASK